MNAQHDTIPRSQEPPCDRTDLAVRYLKSRLAAHPTTRTKSVPLGEHTLVSVAGGGR